MRGHSQAIGQFKTTCRQVLDKCVLSETCIETSHPSLRVGHSLLQVWAFGARMEFAIVCGHQRMAGNRHHVARMTL